MKKSFKFVALFFVFLFNFNCLVHGTTALVEIVAQRSHQYNQIICYYFNMPMQFLVWEVQLGRIPTPLIFFNGKTILNSDVNENNNIIEVYFCEDNAPMGIYCCKGGPSRDYFKSNVGVLLILCKLFNIEPSKISIAKKNSRGNVCNDQLEENFNDIVKPNLIQDYQNVVEVGFK